MKAKNIKGFTGIGVIVGLVVGIFILSATSFYVLKGKKNATSVTQRESETAMVEPTSTPAAQEAAISEKTDTVTLEQELNDTDLDSIDKELDSLDTSANSL